MQYFDEIIDRNISNSFKYDLRKYYFKTDEIIPMWVADMDFEVPPFVFEALKSRLDHKIYGYTYIPDSFYEAIIYWLNDGPTFGPGEEGFHRMNFECSREVIIKTLKQIENTINTH